MYFKGIEDCVWICRGKKKACKFKEPNWLHHNQPTDIPTIAGPTYISCLSIGPSTAYLRRFIALLCLSVAEPTCWTPKLWQNICKCYLPSSVVLTHCKHDAKYGPQKQGYTNVWINSSCTGHKHTLNKTAMFYTHYQSWQESIKNKDPSFHCAGIFSHQ